MHGIPKLIRFNKARLKEGLDGFRNLLNKYQRTRNQWEVSYTVLICMTCLLCDCEQHQSQLTQRATENWIPSISDDIDQSQAIAEEVLAKIPPLEDRLQSQLIEYHRGIEQVRSYFLWYRIPSPQSSASLYKIGGLYSDPA